MFGIMKYRRMRTVGHEVSSKRMRNAYTIVVGKPEGKSSLRGLRLVGG
jgi:hypothetical protein